MIRQALAYKYKKNTRVVWNLLWIIGFNNLRLYKRRNDTIIYTRFLCSQHWSSLAYDFIYMFIQRGASKLTSRNHKGLNLGLKWWLGKWLCSHFQVDVSERSQCPEMAGEAVFSDVQTWGNIPQRMMCWLKFRILLMFTCVLSVC